MVAYAAAENIRSAARAALARKLNQNPSGEATASLDYFLGGDSRLTEDDQLREAARLAVLEALSGCPSKSVGGIVARRLLTIEERGRPFVSFQTSTGDTAELRVLR